MSENAVFFKLLNFLAVAALILSLIGNFLTYIFWSFILSAILKVFLVVCLVFLEVRQSPAIVKPFSFMFYFLGRGIFYFILGFVTMGIDILSVVGGFILVVIGIIYIILHFTHHNKEPEFMSFPRYRRLTSGLSHDLPISNQYPVAHQVPLSDNAQTGQQYNNTSPVNLGKSPHSATVTPNIPHSPAVPHEAHLHDNDKTEVL